MLVGFELECCVVLLVCFCELEVVCLEKLLVVWFVVEVKWGVDFEVIVCE